MLHAMIVDAFENLLLLLPAVRALLVGVSLWAMIKAVCTCEGTCSSVQGALFLWTHQAASGYSLVCTAQAYVPRELQSWGESKCESAALWK